MWKMAAGVAAFAGLAILILMQGGDIDMGGEKHGADAAQVSAAAPAPVAAASAVR